MTLYTLKNSSAKWNVLNCLEQLDYTTCNSIKEYGSNIRDISVKHINMALTIEQVIILTLLNRLGSFVSTYPTIIN